MQFSDAFDISRALTNGFETLKRFLAPMMLGGAMMSFLDGGCNSGFNVPMPSGDDSSVDWQEVFEEFIPSEGGASIQAALTDLAATKVGVPDLLASMPDLGGFGPVLIVFFVLFAAVFILGIGLVFLGLRCWIEAGWIRLHQRILIDGDGNINHLFRGADRLRSAVGFRLLVACIGIGTTVIAMLPGGILAAIGFSVGSMVTGICGGILALICLFAANLYVQLGLALGMHAVVLDNCSAVDAMHQSWALARGNRFTIFFFQFVVNILSVIATVMGLLMLCIGALLTVPAMRAIGDFGFTESYLLLTRSAAERDQWQGVAAAT